MPNNFNELTYRYYHIDTMWQLDSCNIRLIHNIISYITRLG